MKTEIESLVELEAFIATAGHDWGSAIIQGLDLTPGHIDALLLNDPFVPGAVFVNCAFSTAFAAKAAQVGSIIFPIRAGLSFSPGRGSVYESVELLNGYDPATPQTYRDTPDWKSYLASMDPASRKKRSDLGVDDYLYFRTHDLSIEDALDEYLKPDPANAATYKKAVGIMGGHDRERREKIKNSAGVPTADDAPYMKVALLARKLAQSGFTIVTGGGPGAMEAGNLGAWFASYPEESLRAAVRILEAVEVVKPLNDGTPYWNSGEWLAPAYAVKTQYPRLTTDSRTESVGVPTWFYGHEPPNIFASHIAKYFENSLREEGLLAIATHGVIFAEGNAGTVQEIFQDATQNYYQTQGPPSPMVLLGKRTWNRGEVYQQQDLKDKPAWQLLRQLAKEKAFSSLLLLSDDTDQIVTFLQNPPAPA